MAPAKRKQSDAATAPKAKRITAKDPAQPAPPPAEVVLPEHEPLVALLDEARDLDCVGQGSRDMLQMSMKSAFAKPKAERHDFQTKVLSLFDKVLSDTEAKLRQMLTSAEEKVKAIEADKEAASKRSEELTESIANNAKEFEAASAALAAAQAATESAQKELDIEAAKEEELGNQHAGKKAEKERFAAISEQWPTLTKAPEPGPKGAKARSREVDAFMEVFADLPVEQSLLDGLPVALKTKTRGAFAERLIEHSEKALQDRLDALMEEMAASEKKVEETVAVVATARSKLETAEKEMETCQNMLKTATSEAKELQKQKKDADGSVASANKSTGLCASEVEKLEQRLEKFTALLQKYGELRDGPAAATADEPMAATSSS
mmetsp:Transcript_42316/g.76762  ORF Transcript_42316/g.76762 Transcript_42316/m.76762 type:complete len:378 (+) Transcript_42316:72-1205(+)